MSGVLPAHEKHCMMFASFICNRTLKKLEDIYCRSMFVVVMVLFTFYLYCVEGKTKRKFGLGSGIHNQCKRGLIGEGWHTSGEVDRESK